MVGWVDRWIDRDNWGEEERLFCQKIVIRMPLQNHNSRKLGAWFKVNGGFFRKNICTTSSILRYSFGIKP